jgi:hypothetical protein
LCLVALCMDTIQWKKSHDLQRLGKNRPISKLQSKFLNGSIGNEWYKSFILIKSYTWTRSE